MAIKNELAQIKVSELEWSGRALAALKNGGLLDKTLDVVDGMKDDELLSINRMGRGSLSEIRQKAVQAAARVRETELRNRMNRNSNSETTEDTQSQNSSTVAEQTRQVRTRQTEVSDPVHVEFAKSHPALISAIMSGEMLLVPKL